MPPRECRAARQGWVARGIGESVARLMHLAQVLLHPRSVQNMPRLKPLLETFHVLHFLFFRDEVCL